MAVNSIAPGFVKMFYQSANGAHTMILPCRPYQTVAGEWWLNLRSGGVGNIWTGFITSLAELFRPLVHTGTTFQYAELWTVASPGADPFYRATHSLGLAGTSGATPQPATQMLFSFRTVNGGVGRIVLLDTNFGPNQRFVGPGYGNAGILAVVNYLLSNSAWNVGRDDGYVAVVPKVLTKTNDALRRKYNLAS